MNSENSKQKLPDYFPFLREYYLERKIEQGKNSHWPVQCDNCGDMFAEIFVISPKRKIQENDNLYLCESCKKKQLVLKDDRVERLAEESETRVS